MLGADQEALCTTRVTDDWFAESEAEDMAASARQGLLDPDSVASLFRLWERVGSTLVGFKDSGRGSIPPYLNSKTNKHWDLVEQAIPALQRVWQMDRLFCGIDYRSDIHASFFLPGTPYTAVSFFGSESIDIRTMRAASLADRNLFCPVVFLGERIGTKAEIMLPRLGLSVEMRSGGVLFVRASEPLRVHVERHRRGVCMSAFQQPLKHASEPLDAVAKRLNADVKGTRVLVRRKG